MASAVIQQRNCQCNLPVFWIWHRKNAQYTDCRCIWYGLRFSSVYDTANLQLHGRIKNDVIEAAKDLGASDAIILFKIIIPLTLSGIISGIIMVFVPALTSFVISDLLGGGKVLLIGNVIEQEFMQGTNWNLGSGLSVVLMIFVIASMALMNIFDKDGGGTAVW